MSKPRESRILSGSARLSGRLRDLFGKSWILSALSEFSPRLEARFRRGLLCGGGERGFDRDSRLYRLRMICLRINETSFFLRLWQRFVGERFRFAATLPEWLAVLVLLFFPLFSMTGHPSLFLCGAILLTELLWLWKLLCGRREVRLALADCTVLLLGLLFLLGGAVGAGGLSGLWEGLLRAVLLLFWFPAVNLLSVPLWRGRALLAMKLSAAFCAVLGIWEYFFTEMELRWVDPARFSDLSGRVSAPFGNPNILSVLLLLTLPMMLAALLDTERRLSARLGNAVLLLLSGLCLVLTWTRGAWLGALAAMLFFLLSHSRHSAGAVLLSGIPAVCALPFLPEILQRRLLSIGSFADSSIRYRLYTWRGVLRMLREHPFGIGVGSEAFSRIYPRYAVSGTESAVHTHQLFLQVGAELGLPGLLVFLAFLLLLFFGTAHGLAHLHGSARGEWLGCVCGLIGALVMGLFDDIWYHPGMFCLFFAVAALAASGECMENAGLDEGLLFAKGAV